MLAHEFGIIQSINKYEDYNNYCPQKYNCITVDDDIILPLFKNFDIMKTYHHNIGIPNLGLAYYGITLIPPNSLNYFQDVLRELLTTLEVGEFRIIRVKVKSNKSSSGLNELIVMISLAIQENKYIIHFGI